MNTFVCVKITILREGKVRKKNKGKNPLRPETDYHHRLSSHEKIYRIPGDKEHYGRLRELALDYLILHLNLE